MDGLDAVFLVEDLLSGRALGREEGWRRGPSVCGTGVRGAEAGRCGRVGGQRGGCVGPGVLGRAKAREHVEGVIGIWFAEREEAVVSKRTRFIYFILFYCRVGGVKRGRRGRKETYALGLSLSPPMDVF
jgi:hypothetical protein